MKSTKTIKSQKEVSSPSTKQSSTRTLPQYLNTSEQLRRPLREKGPYKQKYSRRLRLLKQDEDEGGLRRGKLEGMGLRGESRV